MEIRFYNTGDEHGHYSNFSRHHVVVGDLVFPTSEHFFQWLKMITTDPKWAEKIRKAAKPKHAANMGRDRNHPLRPDWDDIKDDGMRLAVLAKFTLHKDIQKKLLETGNNILIEATTDDYYWGEGTEKTGKNMLGIILMEVRDVIRNNKVEEYKTKICNNLGYSADITIA